MQRCIHWAVLCPELSHACKLYFGGLVHASRSEQGLWSRIQLCVSKGGLYGSFEGVLPLGTVMGREVKGAAAPDSCALVQ